MVLFITECVKLDYQYLFSEHKVPPFFTSASSVYFTHSVRDVMRKSLDAVGNKNSDTVHTR